ncbi:hypothetical protein OHC33_000933 [Knufia fluminis]|uniref:Xylanolytic transcriptional activator regulatory domain-containing protein n=1 Tax=Knufia fluminis TaxID=191047 RepID=A0AAN8EKG2_9EURO|nr:hypothetical protein OHC33_000933 [Knufia fluminis]
MPGTWVPATAAPPMALPSNIFEEGQAHYIQSPTVNAMPVHLRELDGHEFATIQRELSTVPDLIFDSARPEIHRYIRFDCLEHYWKYFHPSFPIVYKPNFVTNTPPPLLLSAVLAIGSFYDSRPDAKLYSLALQEIATKLLRRRGETITSRSRIADLQTVLLLEILSTYSARHASPETSARFRALYASLHQTRQILVQNPLAVFKTLKKEKSEDDLKRAHKFWLEHEARRRIFHACSVLDAQQVALFEQRATIVTHSNLPNKPVNTRGGIDLPCGEALWEATPLQEWSVKAAVSIPEDVNAARARYQAASVNDYSFFQHQIINLNTSANQRCLEEMSSPPERKIPLSKTRLNYHVFHMAKYIPVRSLLIVAGESWFLAKKIEQEAEYTQAKRIIREWVAQATVPSTQMANSLKAHWHALKVLRMIVDPGEGPQQFRTTNMLHEDWAVYLAALVCWAHGYARRNSPHPAAIQVMQTPTASPSASRKRKATEVSTPSRKRQATIPASSVGPFASSTAAHTTQVPQSLSTTAYANPTWSAYGPVNSYSAHWPTYYDQSMMAYSAQADASTATATATTTDPSAYGSSVRTATNTPHSQSSLATTGVPYTVPTTDDPMIELRTYLASTNVSAPQDLTTLDTATLTRTKGVLDAIRTYKIGAKRTVGGLMNDAERVLSRLAEGKNKDMF